MQEERLLLIDDVGDDFEDGIGMAFSETSRAILHTVSGMMVDILLL